MVWTDGRTHEQEAVDVELSIVAVDLAGNRSAASDPIRVQHAGLHWIRGLMRHAIGWAVFLIVVVVGVMLLWSPVWIARSIARRAWYRAG